MTRGINNVEVLDNGIWNSLRGVTVTKVNIIKDSSLQYELVPTKEHSFMNKIGFSKYIYKSWIKKVEVLEGNIVQLYDYNFLPTMRIKLSDTQINEWKLIDEFIEFI